MVTSRRVGEQVGFEIGYYVGCVTLWSWLVEQHPHPELFASQRTLKSLRVLRAKLRSFPLTPAERSVSEQLQLIRAKMKVMCVRLKVQFPEALSIADFSHSRAHTAGGGNHHVPVSF